MEQAPPTDVGGGLAKEPDVSRRLASTNGNGLAVDSNRNMLQTNDSGYYVLQEIAELLLREYTGKSPNGVISFENKLLSTNDSNVANINWQPMVTNESRNSAAARDPPDEIKQYISDKKKVQEIVPTDEYGQSVSDNEFPSQPISFLLVKKEQK